MNALEITNYELGGTLVFHLKGEIDISNAKYLQQSAASVIDVTPESVRVNVIVDMSDITFVDSSGINALIRVHKQVSGGGGRLTIVKPSIQVRQILGYMALDRVIGVAESVTEAISA